MGLNIAFILDGNRRWAKQHNLSEAEGHKKGAETLNNLFNWIKELKDESPEKYSIDEVTLYVFSMQNFDRSQNEINLLMDLFMKSCREILSNRKTNEEQIKVRFLGRKHLLPENLQKEISKVEDKTKNYNKFTLNFALAYGGREEIIDAINKIIKEKKQCINEKDFPKYLYTESEPDIIIRTGDVSRTSNFFPWQSIYSEWFFLKKMWPEITKEDIKNIINDFHTRERRFGK